MGAFVGLSYVFYVIIVISKVRIEAYLAIILIHFLLQQGVIVAIFLCSKNMHGKYKDFSERSKLNSNNETPIYSNTCI